MTPKVLSSSFRFRAGSAWLLAVLASLASAQTPAPAPTAAAAATTTADDSIMLSPFVVDSERETGWSANTTLSATRTRQDLKDVPVNIDAITADFMEDLGLFTADEVSKFVANVYATPYNENEAGTDNFSFRGLSQRFNISRNYFRWYIPSDTYNVERIDFGKGSNSLIFGDVEPGGQGSAFTKRAQFRNHGSALLRFGSRDAYRAQIDVNRKLLNSLAIRFNYVKRQDTSFQDWSAFYFEGKHGAVTWRPFKNTEIRFEVESGDIGNQRSWSYLLLREQSARSRAFTGAGWIFTSDNTNNIFEQRSLPSADRSTSYGPAGGSLSFLEGDIVDVAMRNSAGAIVGTKRFVGYPANYNLRGTWDEQARPFNTWTLTLEQRIGDLGLEFAYNRQDQASLRNDSYFSQTISVDVNGRPYIDSTGIDLKSFGNTVDAYRFTAAWPWQPCSWMKQLFVLSADYREDWTRNYRVYLYNLANVRAGNVISTTNDRVRYRAYLDDPEFYSKAFFDQFLFRNLPTTAAFQPGFYATNNAGDATEYRQQSAVGLSVSGDYFRKRVQTLFGLRHDWNKTLDYFGTRKLPDGQDVPPPNPKDAPAGEYIRNPNLDQSNNSYTAGVTVRLTNELNAYGVYSESFRFQDARTFDRKPFGPITGVTKEIGLKGSFLQDRVALQLGVFHIDRENVEFRWTPSSFSANDVENLINPNNLKEGDPGYFVPWQDVNQYRDVISTETSKGFDLTLMLRPTRGLQVRVTVGKTDVVTRPDFSSFRAYYEAAVARGDESPALLTEAKNVLESSDFEEKPTGARAAPWSIGWIVDYAFPREAWSWLRGVRAGVNGTWRDNYLLAIYDNVPWRGGQQHPVNAYVMRDQKVWGQQVRVRLGARNIIDLENKNRRASGTVSFADGSRGLRYSYIMPLQWDLTMSVRF